MCFAIFFQLIESENKRQILMKIFRKLMMKKVERSKMVKEARKYLKRLKS
jgi:hypothetical protein